LIEGLAIEKLRRRAAERLAGVRPPAFQFLLAAGGDLNAPLGEGSVHYWNYRAEVAVETPLISRKGGG